MNTEIELGMTVSDCITGFSGVITGMCFYISGCHQALVVPPAKDGDYKDGQWFDQQRLRQVEGTQILALENGATPGCDKQAPKR